MIVESATGSPMDDRHLAGLIDQREVSAVAWCPGHKGSGKSVALAYIYDTPEGRLVALLRRNARPLDQFLAAEGEKAKSQKRATVYRLPAAPDRMKLHCDRCGAEPSIDRVDIEAVRANTSKPTAVRIHD